MHLIIFPRKCFNTSAWRALCYSLKMRERKFEIVFKMFRFFINGNGNIGITKREMNKYLETHKRRKEICETVILLFCALKWTIMRWLIEWRMLSHVQDLTNYLNIRTKMDTIRCNSNWSSLTRSIDSGNSTSIDVSWLILSWKSCGCRSNKCSRRLIDILRK